MKRQREEVCTKITPTTTSLTPWEKIQIIGMFAERILEDSGGGLILEGEIPVTTIWNAIGRNYGLTVTQGRLCELNLGRGHEHHDPPRRCPLPELQEA